MATIKLKYKAPASGEGMGTVCYHISQGRAACTVPTVWRLARDEWDRRRATPVAPSEATAGRRAEIEAMRDALIWGKRRLVAICARFDNDAVPYVPADVADTFRNYCRRYSLPGYLKLLAAGIAAEGRTRTAETYEAAAASFGRFAGDTPVLLDCLTATTVGRYEAWMRGRGLSRNTTSFYMRILRAAYNRAVAEGAVTQRRPFRGVYTGVEKTRKRALPVKCLRRLRDMPLDRWPALAYARDMFMLSFYLRGISFIDLAFLRRADLSHGYVTYRRRKTGQLLAVRWTREMQAIVDRYRDDRSPYLAPVIDAGAADPVRSYRNRAYQINRSLKRLAVMTGYDMPLTMHCARHSWATAARRVGVPLGIISQGMGHRSETTTQIYLDSIDTSAIDRANSRVISALG